jgi:hypothetical protein
MSLLGLFCSFNSDKSRSANYCRLRLAAEQRKNIFYAGLLIQIGKMSLPYTLLEKSYYSIPLADKQRYLKHAVEGETLLKGLPQLKGASILIRHQYEHFDGSGVPDRLTKQKIPFGSRILTVVSDYISYLDASMAGDAMSVSAAVIQLTSRKRSYYDPDIVDAFVKVLKERVVKEVIVETPELKKSWKTSKLMDGPDYFVMERPVVEISWTQVKLDMKLDSVYFENKPYLKSCIVDQKIINNIQSLMENTGKTPIIKIRIGKK